MKIAILIDGGHYRAQWQKTRKSSHLPKSTDVLQSIDRICAEVRRRHGSRDVRLLRTYYYDTEPFDDVVIDPAGHRVDFSANPQYLFQKRLLEDLKQADNVAVRKGQLKFRGWDYTGSPPRHRPLFSQKGVDMKIGLDVAWLSTKRIVDVIILATADTDFVAPMKLARSEGVEVWLYTFNVPASIGLVEHSDVYVKGNV